MVQLRGAILFWLNSGSYAALGGLGRLSDDFRIELQVLEIVAGYACFCCDEWIHDGARLRVRLGKIPGRLGHYDFNANAILRWHFEEYRSAGVRKSIC